MESSYKDLEPVISDWAMSVIEGRLRDQYLGAIPDNTNFVSFVQEPKETMLDDGPKLLPAMAVFAVISDHPTKAWAPRIMTHGTTRLQHFIDAVDERKHYVTAKSDPPIVILSAVLKEHMKTLANLKDLIH